MRRPVLAALRRRPFCWRCRGGPADHGQHHGTRDRRAGAAIVPGVTVTGTNTATGFMRTAVVGCGGRLRLTSLPVGTYDIRAELQGFQPLMTKGIIVNVVQVIVSIDREDLGRHADRGRHGHRRDAAHRDDEFRRRRRGGRRRDRVDAAQRPAVRQPGGDDPGVGLGFHSDPTKSTQYSPQVNGGNGRNVNYQIDGGDNNDDTVGGLLQLFPLEAIQEFNFDHAALQGRVRPQQRRRDEHRDQERHEPRSAAAFFTLFRDKSLNAIDRERRDAHPAGTPTTGKSDYRRYQFGGSFGGPIVQNKAFFFGGRRAHAAGHQAGGRHAGPLPGPGRRVPHADRREPAHRRRRRSNVNPSQFLSVRYGREHERAALRRERAAPARRLGRQHERVQLDQREPQLGARRLEAERVHLPVRGLRERDPARSRPTRASLRRTASRSGYNTQHAADHDQHKWQFRDDFSWSVTGMGGIGHDFKAGVNLIYEPHLYITFNGGSGAYAYTHLDTDPAGKISAISLGTAGVPINLPMKQYALYFQDDWRVAEPPDVQPGHPLRPGDGVPDRPDERHQLQRAAGGGHGRAVRRRPGFRGLGEVGRGGLQQHPAAHRLRRGTSAGTARTWSAADTGSTTTSATPTRTSCLRRSTRWAARAACTRCRAIRPACSTPTAPSSRLATRSPAWPRRTR